MVGRDTFEDSFSDEVLARALGVAFGADATTPISAQEIHAIRENLGVEDKLVDHLPPLVGERLTTYFRKTQLGTALGQVITDPSEIPVDVIACFERLKAQVT